MSEFRKALNREKAEVLAELQRHPAYSRLLKIEDLLKLYPEEDAVPVAHRGALPIAPIAPVGLVPGGLVNRGAVPLNPPRTYNGEETKKARMERAIRELIQEQGGKVHRAQIMARLESKGIMGQEANPMQSLAKFLSENDIFVPIGEGLWGIKP